MIAIDKNATIFLLVKACIVLGHLLPEPVMLLPGRQKLDDECLVDDVSDELLGADDFAMTLREMSTDHATSRSSNANHERAWGVQYYVCLHNLQIPNARSKVQAH
jgi:hypothetical protein